MRLKLISIKTNIYNTITAPFDGEFSVKVVKNHLTSSSYGVTENDYKNLELMIKILPNLDTMKEDHDLLAVIKTALEVIQYYNKDNETFSIFTELDYFGSICDDIRSETMYMSDIIELYRNHSESELIFQENCNIDLEINSRILSNLLDCNILTLAFMQPEYIEQLLAAIDCNNNKTFFCIESNDKTLSTPEIRKIIENLKFYKGFLSTTKVMKGSHSVQSCKNSKAFLIETIGVIIPDYIKILINGKKNQIYELENQEEAKIEPKRFNKQKIITPIILFNGEQVTLRELATDNGSTNTSNEFDIGLLKLEQLHNQLPKNEINDEHYDNLFKYLLAKYQGTNKKVTIRLSDFVADKAGSGLDLKTDNSLRFLLNNPKGQYILEKDIELIMKLKLAGINCEMLIPNPFSRNEMERIYKIAFKIESSMIIEEKKDIKIIPTKKVMIENPLFLKSIIIDGINESSPSIGLSDLTNYYFGLKENYPELFNKYGAINLTNVTQKQLESVTDRKGRIKSTDEMFQTPDFIYFFKTQVLPCLDGDISVCGTYNQYTAAILLALDVQSLTTTPSDMEKLTLLLDSVKHISLISLIQDVYRRPDKYKGKDLEELIQGLGT